MVDLEKESFWKFGLDGWFRCESPFPPDFEFTDRELMDAGYFPSFDLGVNWLALSFTVYEHGDREEWIFDCHTPGKCFHVLVQGLPDYLEALRVFGALFTQTRRCTEDEEADRRAMKEQQQRHGR